MPKVDLTMHHLDAFFSSTSFQLAMEEYMHIMAGISLEHLLTQSYPGGLSASFGNKKPQKSPLRTPIFFRVISENINFKHIIDVFPPHCNSLDIL